MVGQSYDNERRPTKARFVREMNQASLYDHIQRATGRTDYEQLPDLVPGVLSLGAPEQHWFTDRVSAAFNAGKTGRNTLPARGKDAEVAAKVGPEAYNGLLEKVFQTGRAQYLAQKVPTVGHDRV